MEPKLKNNKTLLLGQLADFYEVDPRSIREHIKKGEVAGVTTNSSHNMITISQVDGHYRPTLVVPGGGKNIIMPAGTTHLATDLVPGSPVSSQVFSSVITREGQLSTANLIATRSGTVVTITPIVRGCPRLSSATVDF